FGFRKYPTADAEYSPQDNDQPLRYLLAFLLKLHLDRSPALLRAVIQILGGDAAVRKAVKEFAKGIKTRDGFAIIQGKELLEI
ncbi:MAG: hypothetical protein F6K23_40360, partial [Okeania sp. SIO2C9]|nr:hypothetical protein [Okeania sp. SIO2C9]